jgi:hypothetical protein
MRSVCKKKQKKKKKNQEKGESQKEKECVMSRQSEVGIEQETERPSGVR